MKKVAFSSSKYGRLSIIKEIKSELCGASSKRKRRMVLCMCDCGKEVTKRLESLLNGQTQSCGCFKKECIGALNYKHGEANRTKEYRAWSKILSRCYCLTDKKYPIYGGRGIVVCEEWRNSYEAFLNDMGRCPSDKSSIDRINVNGNYEPLNCRWANNIQQSNNRRNNVYVDIDGTIKTLTQWAEYLNMPYKVLHKRFRYGGETIKQIADGRI